MVHEASSISEQTQPLLNRDHVELLIRKHTSSFENDQQGPRAYKTSSKCLKEIADEGLTQMAQSQVLGCTY